MSHPKKFGKQQSIQWTSEHFELQQREEETLARLLMRRIQKTKKYWMKKRNPTIKFGSVESLLSFSLFKRKISFFSLCVEITIKYFLIFVTAFTTWRIFTTSKITLKIKLLLSLWRWAFFKLLFLTGAMA